MHDTERVIAGWLRRPLVALVVATALPSPVARAGVARADEGATERGGGSSYVAPPTSGVTPRVRIPSDIPVRRGPNAEVGAASSVRAVVVISVLAIAVLVAVQLGRRGAGRSSSRVSGWRRWLSAGGPPDGLRIVHSARLSGRASVHVVRWDGREWLLGCGDHSVTLIGLRGAAEAPGVAESVTPEVRVEPEARRELT